MIGFQRLKIQVQYFQMIETDTADSTFVVTDLQPFTVVAMVIW